MSTNKFKLREYQEDAKREVLAAWASGHKNVCLVLPTGAGKTVLFSNIISEFQGQSIAIAHRQELVSQISLALAAFNIRHSLIGPKALIHDLVSAHMMEFNQSFYGTNANVTVAGVDTLIRRVGALSAQAKRVGLWVQDETHHLLQENKWGKAVAMFTNAWGLGVTATPERADGKGIGRNAAGILDAIIVGPSMRELINHGYLTEYRIVAPPSDIDLNGIKISKNTGEYTPSSLKIAVRKSHVVGDVVEHYGKFAKNMLGVTFASDVETAGDIAHSFRNAGVPAEVVSAETPHNLRREILRRFKNREILQLVNVDLFGEGFDLPAIEVVSMARPTQSFGLYVQQFGRSLRPMGGKQSALIIDHAGNALRHGLPDIKRPWSLMGRDRKSKISDAIPVRVCVSCVMVFERFHKTCPHCGHYPKPQARSGPEFVDGDLTELDPAKLAEMRSAAEKALMSPDEYRMELERRRSPDVGLHAGMKRQREYIAVQERLKESIAVWAGYQRGHGRTDSESYRRFYHLFGVDVLSAQALPVKDARALTLNLDRVIENERVAWMG